MALVPALVRIEVVSDIVCPWCLIGARRLDRALALRPGLHVEVIHHPFLLEPEHCLPIHMANHVNSARGADLRERWRRRYGSPERMFRRLEAVARADGIDLDFTRAGRTVSTISAHTLLRHAAEKGTQRGLVRALYGAYFLEGRDVGDAEVLTSIASQFGFAPAETSELLGDPGEVTITRELARAAAERGVSGVPHTTIGKLKITGAQSVEVFGRALDQALSE